MSGDTSTRAYSGHPCRIALAIALLLLAALLVLAACAGGQDAPVDPFAQYRPAVKQAFQADFDLMADAPRYALDVTVDPSGEWLTGTAVVHLTNTSSDPWNDLVFRLYPALTQYGADMTIHGVLVDGQPATFIYQADNTAIRIDLTDPLLFGHSTEVTLSWKIAIPEWSDDPSVYALFGKSQGMISLPLFYPSLAVYESGPTLGTGHWWLDIGSVRGDAAFNQASLFVVTATLPSDQVPVTSGTLVTSTTLGDEQSRYVWVTGPSREFVLHTGDKFESKTIEAYGTNVTSYWLPGHEGVGHAALAHTVTALRIYSDYFGGYPFRDMRVAMAPLSYRGMEYPQVNLVGIDLYSRFQENLEILVAHEAAHQWWYQIVHNDPVRTPWLDEALSEYSVKLYHEKLYGQRSAELLEWQRWETPLSLLAEQNDDVAIGSPVDSYGTGTQYETLIYGKGALLYERLRDMLGERQFRRFLRDYLSQYRYQIVTDADWLALLQGLDNPDIETLYEQWVQGPAIVAPVGEDTELTSIEESAN